MQVRMGPYRPEQLRLAADSHGRLPVLGRLKIRLLTEGGVALPLGFDADGENCRSLGCARSL